MCFDAIDNWSGIANGEILSILTVICPPIFCPYFGLWTITLVNINGFLPNLVCSLILRRSSLGFQKGKLCYFLTRVICPPHDNGGVLSFHIINVSCLVLVVLMLYLLGPVGLCDLFREEIAACSAFPWFVICTLVMVVCLPFLLMSLIGYTGNLWLFPLQKHAYSNILKILPPKIEIFQMKHSDIFHISA